MKYLFAILSVLLLDLSPARALEITYSSANPFDGSIGRGEGILLRGEIVPGDYEYLLRVIRDDLPRFWRSAGFILASPGGDVEEAQKIARFVKGTYFSVFVGKASGPCVSACFLIYAAAAHRDTVVGSVGIHRPYIHPRRLTSLSPGQAETLQNDLLRKARAFLEDLHVPTNLIDGMFQRASTEVYWLSKNEIEEQLSWRPPWYEQFLIARCGFDKSLEREYFRTSDQVLLDRLVEMNKCGQRLSRPEAERFVRTEMGRTPKR